MVVVCAEGRSYGDEPMRREIEIEPDAGKVRKVAVDTSNGLGVREWRCFLWQQRL